MVEILYQDNLIRIDVEIVKEWDQIYFVQYDLDLFGMESESRMISALSIEQLMSALDVKTDKELIDTLKRDYNTPDAFNRLLSFVSNNNLKYDYYTLFWQKSQQR